MQRPLLNLQRSERRLQRANYTSVGHQFENEKLKTLLANGLSYNLKNGMKVT